MQLHQVPPYDSLRRYAQLRFQHTHTTKDGSVHFHGCVLLPRWPKLRLRWSTAVRSHIEAGGFISGGIR